MGRAGKVLLGAVGVAAVLYGAAQAGVRSPWFRVAVERRLSKAAGMEVHVGRIRATESLNLRIDTVSALEDRAGMEARVLRVKWSWFAPKGFSRIRKISIEDAVLTMAPDAEGHLLPAFAGARTWELVGSLTRGMVPTVPEGAEGGTLPGAAAAEAEGTASGRPHASVGGIQHVRLVRGVFSVRDASGRERVAARDVEIDRAVSLDADGRRSERWDVQADVMEVEGMQLTGIDWAAECTPDGGWKVTRFVSDGWSGWEPAASADAVESATEQYRSLLDSI